MDELRLLAVRIALLYTAAILFGFISISITDWFQNR